MVKLISIAVLGVGAIVLWSFLWSLPVMLLWNGCLVDAVTGINEITWLQAWGISILSAFLFKSSVTNTESK